MPCRALEAFRPSLTWPSARPSSRIGLNALSGIGGVQTLCTSLLIVGLLILCLNALSGIGGVQTGTRTRWEV